MAKDLVFPAKKIEQTLTFDLREFVNLLKMSLEERGYGYYESKHIEKQNGDQMLISFSWSADKKADPLIKQVIDISFFANVKDVIITHKESKKKLQEGTVSVEFVGYLNKKAPDDWTLSPKKGGVFALLREAYDKYLNKDKFERYEKSLSKDIEDIIEDLKSYLKIHKF